MTDRNTVSKCAKYVLHTNTHKIIHFSALIWDRDYEDSMLQTYRLVAAAVAVADCN